MREVQRSYRYDRDAVLASIAKLDKDEPFTLFGGEALILPLKDIDELLALSYARTKSSGLQTNGALITDAHIEAFIKYNTHVGISLDGPDELNDSRWAGTLKATRKQTARTHWAINRLLERSKEHQHLVPSLIVTMHAGNASAERFPRFKAWLHELDDKGITTVNIHVMEMDHCADTLYLPQNELAERFIDLWNETFTNLRISKFAEILKLLKGDDDVVCTWHPCDPWNTMAVKGIENDGSPSHCSRTNKDGKNWLPAEGSGDTAHAQFVGHPGARHFERQMALSLTPQEYGGCQGCEYWLLCYGQCPGEGQTGDWRMRSSYCYTYKQLFAEGAKRLRQVGIVPFCDRPDRAELEARAYAIWANDGSTTFYQLQINTPTHRVNTPHGDCAHGDRAHGDHNDV